MEGFRGSIRAHRVQGHITYDAISKLSSEPEQESDAAKFRGHICRWAPIFLNVSCSRGFF